MNKNGKTAPVIVFDLGGVLMDWDPYYLYSKLLGDDRQAVERFLKAIDFTGWNQEQDRGRTFAEGTAELVARFPEYSELIRAYDERYLESLHGAIQPVVEILRRLKEAGYRLYGLSNWPAEKFALVRPQYPFFEWFDDLVISGEVGLAKPEEAIFDLLLERAGRPAGECLLIDDHDSNIRAARALGFQTILFQSPQQLEAELRRRGILDRHHRSGGA
jgi:2-haloacid dehalogenase